MDKVPTKKIVSVNFSHAFSLLGLLVLENGTDRFFHNIGEKLPLSAT
jgi:hypothetical protein